MESVVIGISGGIDSAVSAFLLKKQGFEVYGLHLNIFQSKEDNKTIEKISEILKISIEIRDVCEQFKETVLSYFIEEHMTGNTPSPCAICNPRFKWKLLEEYANIKKAKYISTGHYIQKTNDNGKWFLMKGLDTTKDQSYYLWGLSQQIVSRMLNPLGFYTKTETRKMAEENGLEFLLDKKESMGLCFAMNKDYNKVLNNYIPGISNIGSGNIVDKTGKIIGTHNGYIYYTIGQKRDLNFHNGENFYVTGIDALNNIIIAGMQEELWKNEFEIKDSVFADEKTLNRIDPIQVKIRGIGINPQGNCKVLALSENRYRVTLEQPAYAIAPGQPAVFYNNEILLGGGFVCLND